MSGIKTNRRKVELERETLRQRLDEVKTKKEGWERARDRLGSWLENHIELLCRAVWRSLEWARPGVLGVGFDRIQDQVEFIGAIDFA